MNRNDDYADLLIWAQQYGIDSRGSFLYSSDAERLAKAPTSSNRVFQNSSDAVHAIERKTNIEWNVASTICGDGFAGLEDDVL